MGVVPGESVAPIRWRTGGRTARLLRGTPRDAGVLQITMATSDAEGCQAKGSGVSAQSGLPSLPDLLGLKKFGGAGEAVIYMHGPESAVDIAMLWKSEDDLKEDVLGIMEKESFTIDDETIGFVQGLIDFWKSAKVQSLGVQADRAGELRDDIRWGRSSGSSSSSAYSTPLPPSFQKQSQKV